MAIKGNLRTDSVTELASYLADTGSANAYAVALRPAITAYTTGLKIRFQVANTNTGASTLAVNGLAAKTIKKNTSDDLAIGDIAATEIITAVYDGTNFQITINGTFAKAITIKSIPFYASPGNNTLPVQSAMWGNRICSWSANSSGGSQGNTIGAALHVGAGTFTTPIPASTNIYTAQGNRGVFASVITTANQQVGLTGNGAFYSRGNAAGQGGFLFVCRFGTETWTAGDRLYVGIALSNGILCTAQPSAGTNLCGFGIDAADTAITFMHNDGSGSATKDTIAGQPALASNQGYVAYIFCKPNDTVVYYRLDDLNLGTTIIDSSTSSDLPTSATQNMKLAAVMGNAANAAVTAAQIGVVLIYAECD